MARKASWILIATLALVALACPARQVEAAGKTGRYNVMLDGCTLPDGNQEAFFQKDAARQIEVAPDGRATLQCRGQVPSSDGYERPKQSIKLDSTNTGAACGTPYGSTKKALQTSSAVPVERSSTRPPSGRVDAVVYQLKPAVTLKVRGGASVPSPVRLPKFWL
jgi:hypothetical protein